MWGSYVLVEVVVKFGVLLVVLRNEVRKNSRNPTSCSVLTSAFNAKKQFIEKENGQLKLFEVNMYLTTSSLYTIGFTFKAIDCPKEKKRKTLLAWIFPQGISYARGARLGKLVNMVL